jgi:hypothetical protein
MNFGFHIVRKTYFTAEPYCNQDRHTTTVDLYFLRWKVKRLYLYCIWKVWSPVWSDIDHSHDFEMLYDYNRERQP